MLILSEAIHTMEQLPTQGYRFIIHPWNGRSCNIQREIVARIQPERAIAEDYRKLIRIYEEKVEKVIERVWAG